MSEYTFSTFQELLDSVPADKIRECMDELGVMLANAKASHELLKEVSGESVGRLLIQRPFTWVDDGKGEIVSRIMTPLGQCAMEVKVKVPK